MMTVIVWMYLFLFLHCICLEAASHELESDIACILSPGPDQIITLFRQFKFIKLLIKLYDVKRH